MENTQNDLTFGELLGMEGFSLDGDTTPTPEVEITLNGGEESTEEKKPTEEVKTEEPTITLTQDTPSIYLELAKEKLASGEWSDLLVGEEGEEKKLSELENLDKETYDAILESFKSDKEEDLKSNYVKVNGLSDIQKSLINIVISGDLEKAAEIFEKPHQVQEPFQGYDEDNDVHNEQVLSWYYNSLGHSENEIKALVQAAKADLTVDDKAKKIVEFQRNQFKENILKKEEEAKAEKLAEEQKIKTYRKELTTDLKAEGLSDTMVKKFVDVATKYDNEGNLEIDNILNEMLSDPKKAKDLIYFALDKEAYLKKATEATKREVQKDVLKKVNIIRDTSKIAGEKTEETQKPKNPFETLSFD